MTAIRLAANGDLVIPSALCAATGWRPGDRVELSVSPEGLVVRKASAIAPTTLDQVIGSTGYRGPALTLEDMEAAVAAQFARSARREVR